MRFKELTEETIEQARLIYWDRNIRWDDRMQKLMVLFGRSERTCRKWCSERLNFKEMIEIEPEQLEIAKNKVHDSTKNRYLITSAQNATSINKKFWKNLKAYAEKISAEILVIPFRYRNPTSLNATDSSEWWDSELITYLTLNRHKLNSRIEVLADIKTQPTATSPLQGLEGMTGSYSCIVGHPRLELKSIPVLNSDKPKIMMTTGCVTNKNFSDSKAGKKGEFHFSTGFSIVEIKDDETYFIRQVSANDKTGEFIDLFYGVKDGVVSIEKDVDAIIMGDIHVNSCDKNITDKTFDDLFKKLYPKKVFIHDIFDGWSISHHNLNDPFLQHKMELDGSNSLQKELDEMILWLKQIEKYNVYVVKSNHDTHIDKFLALTDWRKMTTLKNAIPYMELSTAILKGDAKNGGIPYFINKHYPNIKCLGYNDEVSVNGYLCSLHGDLGASGSKGGMIQFSKLSQKIVVGHSHTIARVGGSNSVGTSTKLRLSYNKGLSPWVNAHGIVNRLGKFQHIIFFNTKDGVEYTTL